MHDTFLYKNISEHLQQLYSNHSLEKLTYIEIDVHTDSHIDSESLYDYLTHQQFNFIDQNTIIKVNKLETVEELTAVIQSVEGKT